MSGQGARARDDECIRVQAYGVWTLAPEEFMNFLRADHALWGKEVKFAGAKAD